MRLDVTSEDRLDKYLAKSLGKPRSQVEQLIKKGYVKVNDKVVKKSGFKVKIGQKLWIDFPKMQPKEAKDVEFDIERIYEDKDILVINKPPGVIIHPAPSVKEPTLVDWLKKEGVSLSTLSGEERHGIVHRLDKETSGVMVVAKSNRAHENLSKQLQNRSMGRYYLAIIEPPLKEDLTIEKPIARNPKNRLKMGIVEGGREAKTFFKILVNSKDEKRQLIAAKLYTGRTHQIRVHLSSINRHILGDTLYGFKSQKDTIPRVFLHAYILYFIHPITNERMRFLAPIPQDMRGYLKENFDMERVDETIQTDTLLSILNAI